MFYTSREAEMICKRVAKKIERQIGKYEEHNKGWDFEMVEFTARVLLDVYGVDVTDENIMYINNIVSRWEAER